MKNLLVYIEINGIQQYVGTIRGKSYEDASFQYAEEYLRQDTAMPISVSLPFQEENFSTIQTKNFFEGLLPEGFSRRAVASWIHADEKDYLAILERLGQECIGAIKIVNNHISLPESSYELLSTEQVKALAEEGTTKSTQLLMESHLSLAGASGKVGLYYDAEQDNWYLPKGDAPSTHIVKQSHVRLEQIVLNEQLCLMTARNLGINVPESFIIHAGQGKEDVLFATKRYDRFFQTEKRVSGKRCPNRLHQEDFSQALGISASDKYEKENAGYFKKMFDVLRRYSVNPIEDQLKLWDMVIFHYLIGNTDCHIKNFSLLYDSNLRGIRLAPAYDIICTRIYKLTNEMSFRIGGTMRIDQITRDSFKAAAKEIGLGEKIAIRRLDELTEQFETAITEAAGELSEQGFADAYILKDKILSCGGYALL